MLDGRSMVVVVIVMLGEVNVRRRQHRGKHHGCNEQRRSHGLADPVGNHGGNLISRSGHEVKSYARATFETPEKFPKKRSGLPAGVVTRLPRLGRASGAAR